MVENLGRKLTLIAVLLTGAALSLLIAGFRLGLDLQGGTRLVYSIPIEQAVDDGDISAQEAANPRALLEQIISIIRERIDTSGVREPTLRAEGTNRIVIELPGTGTEVREEVGSSLLEAVQSGTTTLNLDSDDTDLLRKFPSGGGVVQVEDEKIHYRKRAGSVLRGATRGYAETTRATHAAGAAVQLINSDPWQQLIENVGDLGFYIRAEGPDFKGETDINSERTKVETWVGEHPDVPIEAYNRLPLDDGGPWDRLEWYPMAETDDLAQVPLTTRLQPLLQEEDTEWRFTGEDLQRVYQTVDDLGFPAVGFELTVEKKAAFGDFTGEHEGKQMAIVLNGEIATFPEIQDRLPGQGIIRGGAGGFTTQEVQDLVNILRSGSLRIKPVLEHRERVGATLGDDYVRRGALSAVIGLLVVLVFVVVYYRRLGMFAAISLIANLVMLMGALAFLQATLTLPGVAGIILTVGMAVDANILIYERIREEALRGRKPIQSAKDGFRNALSTIVDANLTTLITALILLKFGTGPIQGFATTLSIGILTSMFSALVITRILVHMQIEKGITSFSMARLIHDTKIGFMSKSRVAITCSIVLITGGLALFLSMPDKQKLGIDFLGGVTMNVRTEAPHDVEDIREHVRSIGGIVGRSSEVKAVLDSGSEATGYNQFRITSKSEGAASAQGSEAEALKDTVENEIRRALGSLLEKGPFDIAVAGADASGTLYFEAPHPEADIAAELGAVGVADAQVSRVVGPAAAYAFQGTVGLEKDKQILGGLLESHFNERRDSQDNVFRWASPVPEVSVVGAQVVTELRDNAIKAILISLFAVVMYIRVRFTQYSYGFAAVAALVHDVLITLGVLAVAVKFDLVEAEINLPMIAAFLTIIGYSLNDTIVVFDRVRENLPRTKGSLADIIDKSINQTLSRTVLTSATTLLTVGILLAFNLGSRNVLEGFTFALMIGVVVGTYSSMFIASPVLLFLENRRRAKAGDELAAEPEAQVQTSS